MNNHPFMVAEGVAVISGSYYASLEEAFAAANDGDTITVLKNCSGNGIKAPQSKFTNGLSAAESTSNGYKTRIANVFPYQITQKADINVYYGSE